MTTDHTPRCATCKHWKKLDFPRPIEEVYLDERDVRDTDLAPGLHEVGDADQSWGLCRAPSAPGHIGASRLMQVWDASMYSASLTTRDIFGCVEHEANL